MAKTKNKAMLGDYFSDLKIPSDERKRIASLAENKKLPANIIKTYVTQTKLYREIFQKREKIPGFRAGTPAYDKQAVHRIIQYLGNERHRRYDFFWEMYRSSAVKYVITELPALDKLMRETPLSDGTHDPADSFRTACSNAALFDVSEEDLQKFYEIWWMPRFPNVDEMISLCSIRDPGMERERKLNLALSDIDAIKSKIADLCSSLEQISSRHFSSESTTKSYDSRFELVESNLSQLAKEISIISNSASNNVETRFTQIDDRIARLAERQKALESNQNETLSAKEIKAELKKSLDESRRGAIEVKSSFDKAKELLGLELKKSIDDRYRPEFEKIEAKITSLSTLSVRRDGSVPFQFTNSTSKYRSPLNANSYRHPSQYRIKGESEFIAAWIAHLLQSIGVVLSFEQAFAYHLLFVANNVIIADFELVQSWIECMGWQSFSMNIVASPIWSTEEDWAPGAEHLFSENPAKTPKLLVIHNFDVGLSDCYLAPSLQLWNMSREFHGRSKLFLIPGDDNREAPHQVHEHAAAFQSFDTLNEFRIELKPGCKVPKPLSGQIPVGVSPEIFDEWNRTSNSIESDLRAIQSETGISLSRGVVTNFRRTVNVASRLLTEVSSFNIGIHYLILPWVKAKYGQVAFERLKAYLQHNSSNWL